MRRRSQAITFVEVLVVIAIIVLLCGIVFVLIGPPLERKKLEARIRSDLKQIVTSINLYRADWDDGLPIRQEVLTQGTPSRIPGLPSQLSLNDNLGGNLYFYTQPYRMQFYSSLPTTKNRFDPDKDPIVKAHMLLRKDGRERFWLFNSDGTGRWAERQRYLCMGARLDGSVAWFPFSQPFEEEFAARSHLLGGIK